MRIKKERERTIYETYIADSLYFLQNGLCINARYSDLFKDEKQVDGDEIAVDIITRAKLKPKGGEK